MRCSRNGAIPSDPNSPKVVFGEDLLGREVSVLFEDCGPGDIWIEGGVNAFVEEGNRLGFAKMVERGDVQFFGHAESPFCRALPLALIDFSYYEKDGVGCVLFDAAEWTQACRTLSMYAGLRGVAGGFSPEIIRAQCQAVATMRAIGRNKP